MLKFAEILQQQFLLLRAEDCGLKHRSGKTKDYEIGIYCFSTNHQH